jgi:hypothetical protein
MDFDILAYEMTIRKRTSNTAQKNKGKQNAHDLFAKAMPYLKSKREMDEEQEDEDVLPDELWLEVFAFLADTDLLACSLVCGRWHHLTQDARSPPSPTAVFYVL